MNESTYTQTASQNKSYQAESIIQMRLDTSSLLADLEAFYRGTRVVGYGTNPDGSIKPILEQVGVALMNDIGIQRVMSWLTGMFNPQLVQGNKKEEDYIDFVIYFHQSFAAFIMTNLYTFGIDEEDYDGIVDQTVMMADMFFSRTIDNKERESYADTIRSFERVGESGGSMLNPFKGNGGKPHGKYH